MKRQNLLFALIAILIAGFLTYGIFVWTNIKRDDKMYSQPTENFSSDLEVLVAAIDIPFGRQLTHKDLRWQRWPKAMLVPAYAVKGARTIDDFIDGITYVAIHQGQPVEDHMIVKPNQYGPMANLLSPGMRAVSINVDRASGVAGFIFPGDHVDIILTKQERTANQTLIQSETFLENIKVLALDQSTSRDHQMMAKLAKTITLEVTLAQAKQLAIAQVSGQIQMALKSIRIQPKTDKD